MRLPPALALFVALAGLASCSSPCGDMKAADDALNQKACAGATKQGFNASTCDQNVSKCSADDDKVIKTFASCVSNLDTCTSDNQSHWNTAALACAVGLTGLSSDCSKAFK